MAALMIVSLMFWPFRLALTVTDPLSGKLVFATPVQPGDTFSIQFIHSVHRTPVEEFYQISDQNQMTLFKVVYESYGIGNPSSLSPGEKFDMNNGKLVIDNMNRGMDSISLRIGQIRADHQLFIQNERFRFADMNEPGSKVLIEVKRISLTSLWRS